MHPSSYHIERLKAQTHELRGNTYADVPHARQPIHKARTSLGAVGHWVRTAGILAPLVIGEFIKDPDKKWRAVRIATVATTLVSEGLYTNKIRKERALAQEREYDCQQ